MSDAFWHELPLIITAFGIFITSLIAAIMGVINNRKLIVVEKATNGLGAALAASQKQVGHAEGKAEGRAEGEQSQRTRRGET